MLRRPTADSSATLDPPRLATAPGSPQLLLPSEHASLGLLDSSSSPRTPEVKKKSRASNDIFSFDWSPSTPNVASRSSTPPIPSSPISIPRPSWRAKQRDLDLEAAKKSPSIKDSLPLTPPSPPRRQPSPPARSSRQPTAGCPPSLGEPSPRPPIATLPPRTPPSPEFYHGETGKVEVRTGGAAAASSATGPGISDNPVLDLRQSPRLRLITTRDHLLGEGRHASVYLASHVPRNSETSPLSWLLCAAKRVYPDRESQLAGLGEAFILSKLAAGQSPPFPPGSLAARGSQFILGLYGVKDERDGVESMGEEDQVLRRKKAWEDASGGGALGLGRPSNSASHTDLRAVSELAAATSASKIPHRRSLRRQRSFTPSDLSPLIGSPTVEGQTEYFSSFPHGEPPLAPSLPQHIMDSSNNRKYRPRHSEPPAPRNDLLSVEGHRQDRIFSDESTTSTAKPPTSPKTPRMILLLEYCPFGHALSFAKQFPERIGRRRWLEWARQLVAAVAWAHERGVLHADIKPQNVLVASDLSIRLADFGMSSFLPSPSSSLPPPSDPIGLGTPPYSPPEFVRPPPSPFGRASDVWSLGVCLSVLISGHEPYENMRTVERMLWVSRGGYWDWEERRREGGLESANVSRQGSMRSVRTGRSRAGSGASRVGSSAGLSVAGGKAGRRSGSADSDRSVRSVGSVRGAVGRGSWTLAVNARRLLSDDSELAIPPSSSPGTPPSTASFAHHAANPPAFLILPPPSPTLDEERQSDLGSDDHHGAESGEDDDYTTTFANSTYADGTPHQYFLNGELVPQEVRKVLRAMTSARESDRPTAKGVLAILDFIL